MVARLAETLQKQAMDSYNMEQAATCKGASVIRIPRYALVSTSIIS